MAGLAARLTTRDGREPLEELYPALHSTSFLQKPVAQTRYFSVTECRLLEVGLKEPRPGNSSDTSVRCFVSLPLGMRSISLNIATFQCRNFPPTYSS